MAQLHIIDNHADSNSTDETAHLLEDFLACFPGRPMLIRKEVRQFLGISSNGLERWEKEGGGPPCFKHRHTVRYPTRAFCRWLAEHCV